MDNESEKSKDCVRQEGKGFTHVVEQVKTNTIVLLKSIGPEACTELTDDCAFLARGNRFGRVNGIDINLDLGKTLSETSKPGVDGSAGPGRALHVPACSHETSALRKSRRVGPCWKPGRLSRPGKASLMSLFATVSRKYQTVLDCDSTTGFRMIWRKRQISNSLFKQVASMNVYIYIGTPTALCCRSTFSGGIRPKTEDHMSLQGGENVGLKPGPKPFLSSCSTTCT